MIIDGVDSQYRSIPEWRIYQGDILKNISFFIWIPTDTSDAKQIDLPYSVVLSQDCDLQQDFDSRNSSPVDNDKELSTILVCPAYDIERFCAWEQIIWKKMKWFNPKLRKKVIRNDELKRYHYLEGNDNFPGLVIDFKHFYTIDRDLIYNNKDAFYICSMLELFRENLSHRFTNFLSRIGLPHIIDC